MITYNLNIHTNLAALQSVLMRSVQQTIDIVSFGLVAATGATDDKQLQLPNTFFHISTASNERMDFQTARMEFERWALTGGIRDCIEAVNIFLEEVRPICFLYSVASQGTIMGEQWNAVMVDERKAFHRRGLPKKIEFLCGTYDSALRPVVTDDILSINNARNCLVHRKGIVSEQDLNSGDGLLVQWTKAQLFIEGPMGKRIATGPEVPVEAGEVVSLQFTKTEKLFQLGGSVRFSAEEFNELCMTFMFFGTQLVKNIEDYGISRGVPFNPQTESLGGATETPGTT